MKHPIALYIVLIITDIFFLIWDILRGSYVFAAIWAALAAYLIFQTVRFAKLMKNSRQNPPEDHPENM